MTQPLVTIRTVRPQILAAIAVTAVAILWAYWTTLAEAAERWAHDPQYSHGYLVPGFALLLLWLRRDRVTSDFRPNWLGLGVLGGALALRLTGTYFHLSWLDPISLLPALAGICLLFGGLRCLAWAWPAIAFLFFMIPLPYSLSIAAAGPLQRLATEASTFLLQALGRPAVAEGNVILLNEIELGVVEACSGLRMLVVFFALSTAVAILIKKPLWERLLICASAVPIALVTNILRVTVTGVLHDTVGKEIADAVFHDLAGWLMMPFALGLLALEMKFLKHLLIEVPPAKPTLADPSVPMPALAAAGPAAVVSAPTAAAPPETPRLRRRRQTRPEVAKPFSRG